MENRKDMPMGLAFQMSMNAKAMENFAKMTEDEKKQVLEKWAIVREKLFRCLKAEHRFKRIS